METNRALKAPAGGGAGKPARVAAKVLVALAVALLVLGPLWHLGVTPVGSLRVSLEASAAYGRPILVCSNETGFHGGGVDTHWEHDYRLLDAEGVEFSLATSWINYPVMDSSYSNRWFEAHRDEWRALAEGHPHVSVADAVPDGAGDDRYSSLVVVLDSADGAQDLAAYLLELGRGMPRVREGASVCGRGVNDDVVSARVFLSGRWDEPVLAAYWSYRGDWIREVSGYGGGLLDTGESDSREIGEDELAALIRSSCAALEGGREP